MRSLDLAKSNMDLLYKQTSLARPFSDAMSIDPDKQLNDALTYSFKNIILKFDSVFDPEFSGYIDYSGKI